MPPRSRAPHARRMRTAVIAGWAATRSDAVMVLQPTRPRRAAVTGISPGVMWWYNWTHVPDQGVRGGAYRTLGLEYAPMISADGRPTRG